MTTRLKSTLLQLLIGVYFCQVCTAIGFTVANETALRAELMSGYNREVRPSATTIISLQLHVTAVNSVDIKNEIFTLSGWWSMVWSDDRLNWQTSTYNSIPVLQFKEDRIWSPVLVVSNSVDDLTAIDEDTIPLRTEQGGRVIWNPPALLKVSCTMDVTYFPFDKQTCTIEVTSFGYTVQELDIRVYSDGLSFRYYQPSGEWDIISTSSDRGEYSEDGYTYARVNFDIQVERKPLYYGVNMILPIVVNAGLTLFVFLLPPESGEKIGFCLTVLLAFMVILTLVATDLPTTATSTPLLEVYIAIVLVLGGLSVVLAILVLHIFFLPEEKQIPEWVKKVTLVSMKVFIISRVKPAKAEKNDHAISTSDVHATHPDIELENKQKKLNRQHTLNNIQTGKIPEDEHEVTWQIVASTIDGVCFRLYALCFIITTIVIMVVLSTQ